MTRCISRITKMVRRSLIVSFLAVTICFTTETTGFAGTDEVVLPALQPTVEIGTYGSAKTQLRVPTGIALDTHGRIYVVDSGNSRIAVYNIDGTPTRTWGSFGGHASQFNHPLGIAIAPDGTVLVADTGNNRIQAFTGDGKFLGRWGRFGTGSGFLNYPTSVLVDGNGQVFVANTANNRIDVFDAHGTHRFSFGEYGAGPGQFESPSHLAIGRDGRIYVVDTGNQRIQVFSPRGEYLKEWGTFGIAVREFRNPTGLVVIGDRVLVVDNSNHRIQAFDLEGNFLYKWGVHPTFHEIEGRFHYPMAIAASPDGKYVVASQPLENKVMVFQHIRDLQKIHVDAVLEQEAQERLSHFHYSNEEKTALIAGKELLILTETDVQRMAIFDISEVTPGSEPKFLGHWGSFGVGLGQFKMPEGIAVHPNGTIFVADRENSRIQAFNPEGKVVAAAAAEYGLVEGRASGCSGLDMDKEGNLYMTDATNNRVQVRAPNGAVRTWGKYGSGNAEFNLPLRIGVSPVRNIVYVVDRNNLRIQAFEKSGRYLFQWGGHGSEPGKFISPLGITVDSDGDVYVADVALNRVEKFDWRGRFKLMWGEYGPGQGQFFFPTAVAVDSKKHVYVANFGNHRGDIFTTEGKFIGTFGSGILHP